jgi:hypothetical protein
MVIFVEAEQTVGGCWWLHENGKRLIKYSTKMTF